MFVFTFEIYICYIGLLMYYIFCINTSVLHLLTPLILIAICKCFESMLVSFPVKMEFAILDIHC